jgi:hypothetical protein
VEFGREIYYQGAETATVSCVEDLILQEWSIEMGGAVAYFEYRFFDESKPDGFDVNDPTLSDWSALMSPKSTRALLEYSFAHVEELYSSTVIAAGYGPDDVPYPVRMVQELMKETVLDWIA